MKELIDDLEQMARDRDQPDHYVAKYLREAAKALRELTELRPMSEAPRNGTAFLGWMCPGWCVACYSSRGDWWLCNQTNQGINPPIGWLPLPPPQEAKNDTQARVLAGDI